jgi:hypothetical protein
MRGREMTCSDSGIFDMLVGEEGAVGLTRAIKATGKGPRRRSAGTGFIGAQICLFLSIAILAASRLFAGDCFIGKPAYAVTEPYLVERVCYLYAHEARMYKPGLESEFVGPLPTIEHHPDPLHVEFLKLLVDKKFMPLARGTPVFSCQYDLETIKRSPDEARMKGYVLPEFNCRGFTFQLVPVRVVNSSTCVWVAELSVRCEEQIEFKTTPFQLFEDELRK